MKIEVLSELLARCARVSFAESRERFGGEEIIGYSILSHDTADSCGPVVATKNGLSAYKYDSKSDFVFSPVEWNEFDNRQSFNKVNEEIGKLYDGGDYEVDPEWHEKFRELVFEANVRGLEILIQEGFFGLDEIRDNIFVLFCVSDSETFNTHEPDWVKRLNTPAVLEKYNEWYEKIHSKQRMKYD